MADEKRAINFPVQASHDAIERQSAYGALYHSRKKRMGVYRANELPVGLKCYPTFSVAPTSTWLERETVMRGMVLRRFNYNEAPQHTVDVGYAQADSNVYAVVRDEDMSNAAARMLKVTPKPNPSLRSLVKPMPGFDYLRTKSIAIPVEAYGGMTWAEARDFQERVRCIAMAQRMREADILPKVPATMRPSAEDRAAWSSQLRKLQAIAREKERTQVVVDHDDLD